MATEDTTKNVNDIAASKKKRTEIIVAAIVAAVVIVAAVYVGMTRFGGKDVATLKAECATVSDDLRVSQNEYNNISSTEMLLRLPHIPRMM